MINRLFFIIALVFALVVVRVIDYSQRTKCKDNLKKQNDIPLESNREQELETDPNSYIIWLYGVIICLLVWLLSFCIVDYWSEQIMDKVTLEKKGLFGDSFGAVNALISAFAFAGVIVTFMFQRIELKLQRQELSDQRKEFKDQNQTLKRQRFDNIFFNLLTQHRQIINELSVKKKIDGKIVGLEVFKYLYEDGETDDLDDEYSFLVQNSFRFQISTCGIQKGYSDDSRKCYLDHYFRNLYTILNFIKDEKSLDVDEKYEYAKIFRSCLSSFELVHIYYNGLTSEGERLKPLIEEFCILNNLRGDLLSVSKDSMDLLGDYMCKVTDYEILMTDEENDAKKYNIRAFFREEEIEEGKNIIKRMNKFLASRKSL